MKTINNYFSKQHFTRHENHTNNDIGIYIENQPRRHLQCSSELTVYSQFNICSTTHQRLPSYFKRPSGISVCNLWIQWVSRNCLLYFDLSFTVSNITNSISFSEWLPWLKWFDTAVCLLCLTSALDVPSVFHPRFSQFHQHTLLVGIYRNESHTTVQVVHSHVPMSSSTFGSSCSKHSLEQENSVCESHNLPIHDMDGTLDRFRLDERCAFPRRQ